MSNFFRNGNLRFTIILSFFLFLSMQAVSLVIYAASIYSFENPPGVSIDMYWTFGFPYPIFYGRLPSGAFWWRGALGNLLIAAIFGFIAGFVFRFMRANFGAIKLR